MLDTQIRLYTYRAKLVKCIVARMLLLTTLILAASTRALEEVDNGSCCDSITLSSGGMGDFYQVSQQG